MNSISIFKFIIVPRGWKQRFCPSVSLSLFFCLSFFATPIYQLAAQTAGAAHALPLDSAALLEKADSFRAFNNTGFSYDLSTLDEEGAASLMRVSVRLIEEEAALVRYMEPANQRGQIVLVRGDAFWLYEPGMASALRISPRQILFGQASAGDLSRISFAAMYDVAAREDAKDLILLKLKAKPNAGATYELVDLYIDALSRPVKALCKGKSGSLMKTIRYTKYEKLGGKTLLSEFVITDEISKRSERLSLSAFSAEMPPDAYFSVQALGFIK